MASDHKNFIMKGWPGLKNDYEEQKPNDDIAPQGMNERTQIYNRCYKVICQIEIACDGHEWLRQDWENANAVVDVDIPVSITMGMGKRMLERADIGLNTEVAKPQACNNTHKRGVL